MRGNSSVRSNVDISLHCAPRQQCVGSSHSLQSLLLHNARSAARVDLDPAFAVIVSNIAPGTASPYAVVASSLRRDR